MTDPSASALQNPPLSRRNFLRLSFAGLFALILPRTRRVFAAELADQQGRVTAKSIDVFETPSLDSPVISSYPMDSILPVSQVTIGGLEPAHNRIWYGIGSEGYAHSGSIQPVQTLLNEPQEDIPRNGALAEVTIPFTDARYRPRAWSSVAYRLYYESTHWVTEVKQDPEGRLWYGLFEDRWELRYYVPAEHLRLLTQEDISPLSPDVPPEAKHIQVDLEKQTVTAFEWETAVFMARAATGAVFSNGRHTTPTGSHNTFYKRPSRHMAAGNLAYNGFDLPGVPWVSYITEKGVAFHGTYWHNDYGRPRSHGCINLTPQAARWLYRWTIPNVPATEQSRWEKSGTTVIVF